MMKAENNNIQHDKPTVQIDIRQLQSYNLARQRQFNAKTSNPAPYCPRVLMAALHGEAGAWQSVGILVLCLCLR